MFRGQTKSAERFGIIEINVLTDFDDRKLERMKSNKYVRFRSSFRGGGGIPRHFRNEFFFNLISGRCSEVPGGLPGSGGMLLACAGCDKPILDKFLLNVLDRTWHAECVRCHDCRAALADKCFSREGKLFCRNDFFR